MSGGSLRARRHADTDGVFISAADLFSLLSIVLLGFVIFEQSDSLHTVDMTEVLVAPRLETEDSRIEPLSEMLEARWQQSGEDCTVLLFDHQAAEDRSTGETAGADRFVVPCTPTAFSSNDEAELEGRPDFQRLRQRGLAWQQRSPDRSLRDVRVYCEPAVSADAALMQCARLQWTLFEANYNPQIVVAERPKASD